jgi:DNA processing protein
MILDELALTFVPDLGARGVAHLMDIYDSAEAVYAQKEHNLILCAELRRDIAARITQKVGYAEAECELRYCEEHGIKATSYNDCDYPPLLREAADRPHVVYSVGDIEALQSKHILSVVGTRRISAYGEGVCARLIPELADMFPDLVVVSGLAFGVDAAAHRAALAAGVRTVAVIANKLPDVTPAQHRNLAKDMLDNGGAIVTELNSQTKQNGTHYIPRNRIIAGVAEGLLVVESPANGGSLSTAKAADAYSRTVMAVPGRINDSRSEGTNHLIKTNVAQLVTSAKDIATALGWEIEGAMPEKIHFSPREVNAKERLVLASLADNSDGLTIDTIAEHTALSVSEVSAILLNMELSGLVRQLPGRRYVIC